MLQIKQVSPHVLKPNPHNARTHSKGQIRQISESILAFGFVVPIAVEENNIILSGHGRLAAALELGLTAVPVVAVEGLSEAKKRALLLADNKLVERGGWNRKQLAVELPELAELLLAEDLHIEITGFAAPEVDQIVIDFEESTSDPEDHVAESWLTGGSVSRRGDLWRLGDHRLLCGDARSADDVESLMAGETASAASLDPRP